VTVDILIREDTGTHAVVRVIEPDAPVSAPYSRAIGLLERWVAAERHAVDEFAAWIEGQAAQAHAEMRLLCDELGLPFVFAELPVVVEPRRGWTPARRPSDVLAEAYRERADAAEAYMRADTSDDMPGRDDGWTPKPRCGVVMEGLLPELLLVCIEPPGHALPHRTEDGAEFWPRDSGWTPTRPVIVVDIPVPDLVQTGPQGRFARWFDDHLRDLDWKLRQWWRGKQAERDRRMEQED
jgi:hypothetical protein